MLDLFLIIALGFLGSFGHCMGMCGPVTVAFSLSHSSTKSKHRLGMFRFHLLLNIGRVISYGLVGGILGGLGSIFIASGQLIGIGSSLRQGMAILTGLLLIWFGLAQIKPDWLPRVPFLHPLTGALHNRLNSGMMSLSLQKSWWTPPLLGGIWGFIPCGFLYAAQLKAIETGSFLLGAITMLCFGLGTIPMMLGIGISTSKLSTDKRSQLFKVGGWVTLAIGFLTLLRTDAMIDYTGHSALLFLIIALVARPLSSFWSTPLRFRRLFGVGAFILALTHTTHMLEHSLNWNFDSITFMLIQHRWGIIMGFIAILLLTPAAATSFDSLQQALGNRWRQIHLLTVPAFILAIFHTILLGSHYLGALELTGNHYLRVVLILLLSIIVLVVRSRWFSLTPIR